MKKKKNTLKEQICQLEEIWAVRWRTKSRAGPISWLGAESEAQFRQEASLLSSSLKNAQTPKQSNNKVRNKENTKNTFIHRERERKKSMSGGIARGRLAEERKAWRKNHPHVRTALYLSLFLNIVAFEGIYFNNLWFGFL